MDKKCNRYEQLFIKEDESELLEHIKTCKDCAKEHENMQKVSSLLKEVSFTYRRNQKSKLKIQFVAASFALMFMAFSTIHYLNPDSYLNNVSLNIYEDYSYEQMGLPVDDYGLIMVDFDN